MNRSSHSGTMKIEYHASILRAAKTERDICITMLLEKQHYFWFGEVGMAGILAGSIAVPAGIWFARRSPDELS